MAVVGVVNLYWLNLVREFVEVLEGSSKSLPKISQSSQKSSLGCRDDVAGEQMGNWFLWRSFEQGGTCSIW